MQEIVFIPGAWMGSWIWNDLFGHLKSTGTQLYSLTLTGLCNNEEGTDTELETHVSDVINFIESNTQKNVILVGHSYSGVVAGIVATRKPELVKHIVYIEAFLPIDGKSLLDVTGLDSQYEIKLINNNGGRWPHPTYDELKEQPMINDQQIQMLIGNFVDHPGKTITDSASIKTPVENISSTYIGSSFPSHINLSDWSCKIKYTKMDKGHWPKVTAIEELGAIMREVLKI